MRRLLLGLILMAGGRAAHAQYQSTNWLHLDYTYTDFRYQEPGAMTERGPLAGVRGEFGLNVLGVAAVSVGGEYQDGHTNYDGSTFSGTPVKQVTNDFFSDLRAMAHIVTAPFVLSVGVAERFWYDNLVVSYHRRTRYNYNPVQLSYFMGSMYVTVEQDFWGKGTNTSTMTDVGSPHDVNFTLGKGTGFGAEVGCYIPGQMFNTHLYVRYHKWSVKQSDVQNDGTQNLIEPDNNTTTLQGGIGVAF